VLPLILFKMSLMVFKNFTATRPDSGALRGRRPQYRQAPVSYWQFAFYNSGKITEHLY
jgi:hypothetical protein